MTLPDAGQVRGEGTSLALRRATTRREGNVPSRLIVAPIGGSYFPLSCCTVTVAAFVLLLPEASVEVAVIV
jgi:hypothetical protein